MDLKIFVEKYAERENIYKYLYLGISKTKEKGKKSCMNSRSRPESYYIDFLPETNPFKQL